ncbi:hypothetical protein BDR26DRAFT_866844 [Obelidium mucronatum]|nr:hypothetical protein BDR26DRAFT_866844 [Obelidium mucronatum]
MYHSLIQHKKTEPSIDTPRRIYSPLFIIMSLFNILSLVYNFMFLYSFLLNPQSCWIADFLCNVFAQLYYLVFDSFILFKSWSVAGFDKTTLVIALICVLHRAGWALFDLITSNAVWVNGSCVFIQNPLSGSGVSAADLLCDFVATIVSLWFCKQRLKNCFSIGVNGQSFANVLYILISENVLRSFVILITNSLILWCNFAAGTDPMLFPIVYAIQSWVFARLLNMEFVWVGVRKAANEGSSHHNNNSKANSSISKQTSSLVLQKKGSV